MGRTNLDIPFYIRAGDGCKISGPLKQGGIPEDHDTNLSFPAGKMCFGQNFQAILIESCTYGHLQD